jgi:hypothetical protein
MIEISTALSLIILSFISGLLFSATIKKFYYLIKSIQRSKRKYKKITFLTDLNKWGGE